MSKRGVFNFPTGTSFNEARVGVRGNDPDYLYYNAQIINNSTATTSKTNDPDLRYQDTRAVAILQDKSNYGVSVENFTINGAGKNLPVFIPQIREFNSDGSVNRNPNNTVYDITFTVQYGQQASPVFTYQSTRSVQWETENKAIWVTQPSPLGVYQYPQPEIPYYYCYTYSHWVKLVNKALALAWGDVISAAKNGGVPGLSIVINSLSGSKCTLENVQGNFVKGARVRSIGTGVESIGEITFLVPFVINIISGNFTPGTEIEQSPEIEGQLPDVNLASAIIDTIVASTFNVGQEVECINPANDDVVGTGIVVSYEGNTVVVYNVVGEFVPGYELNQEPNVGTASITSTSIFEEFTVPEILLGTKCPFYTYDPKTNLFSLWQDSNTCVVPFGSAVPSPSPLSGFGASTADGYVPGEFSFIGYNTNFESLFTNFNTTYYSDQVPLATGASIQSPVGTESISQATVVNTDGAKIVSFPDGTNQMTVQWSGTPVSVAGSNWTFDSPLVSSSQLTLVTGSSRVFVIPNVVAGYVQLGFVFTVTASNGKSATGYVTAVARTGQAITSITLQILSADPLCSGSGWKFTLPIDSLTFADPQAGVEVSLVTDVYPHQTPLVAGYDVKVTGPQGQEFTGSISSFTETIGYTGATGIADQFITYDNSTLLFGFNPVVTFQAQTDTFVQGNIVQGNVSKATGKIIEITSGNEATENTIRIVKQSGPFTVGDTWTTSSATGKITDIDGLNSATSVVRTGFLTIGNTYVNPADTKTYYSGPFAVGNTIQDSVNVGNSAVITSIEGDNGYSTVTYSQQKNPFVIGHQIECYASLSNTDPSATLCSGTVVDVIGENLGYGTVNIGNQNGQFGIGEVIVNDFDNSVATIVGIDGPNNGYGTVSYINQQTSGAPGAFVPGEFLCFADNLQAFAKVVLDTQNVLNLTEGNIGSVTVITGVEENGVFTPTSNVPLPGTGSQIIGTESGTVADFGGIVYLDSAVLTVNNIAGSFNVGDRIVDNVGFGIANTLNTISVTATCNGFSYLGNGELILKNISGGTGSPQKISTSNFIIDYDSKTPPTVTNTIAMNIVNITPDRQFINGDPVQGQTSGARGTVITNCGSFPYPGGDPSSQLLTILPDVSNTTFFIEGEDLADTRPGVSLQTISAWTGPFLVGDSVQNGTGTGNVYIATPVNVPGPSGQLTNVFAANNSGQNLNVVTLPFAQYIPLSTQVTGSASGAIGTVIATTDNGNVIYTIELISGSGNFTTSDTLQWPLTAGVSSLPTSMILANVNGTFASSGTITNKSRKFIRIEGISIPLVTGTLYRIGTFALPVPFGQMYNWNTGATITCMGFVTVTQNIANPGGPTYNRCTALYDQASLEEGELNINDCMGPLPFITFDNAVNPRIKPSGVELVISNNAPGFIIGSEFTATPLVSAAGIIIGLNGPASDNSYTLKIAMNTFTANNDSPGLARGDSCRKGQAGPTATITKINYYTNGFSITSITKNLEATATFASSTPYNDTEGIIASINISASSAYVQTSKPPANTTALTLTNIDGTFTNGALVRDLTTLNYGSVQDFNETTDYTDIVTTLTISNVVGSVESGALITDSNSETATINSVFLSNGGFIMQPITGTLLDNEELLDLGSFATATYTGSTRQTIVGLTSDTTAEVLLDSGDQLKLTGITGPTGGFEIGETVQSSLGIQADIIGFPLFGVGNILRGSSGGTGTIVSDSGTQVVIKNVQGQFYSGNVLTSAGATATASSVSAPTLNIVPYNSTGDSTLWTIVPASLTSTTTATPVGGQQSLFSTNLTIEQTIFNVGDTLSVTEVDPILTIEELYYPENVVQVDLSAGNYSIETLQSVFPSGATGTQYVVLVQDFESTSSLWSPVASIVIGTQFITVREEYSGTPITIGTGNLGSNASTGSFQKVLLETPIEVLPQESWRGLLYYEQKVEKMSSLGMSKEDLKNLDIQVYWRNRLTNSLTPLTLYNGGSANIRILFKRIHE